MKAIHRPLSRQTVFFDQLYSEIEKQGGLFNAHLHLDRAGTLDAKYQQALPKDPSELSYISLQEKHKRIFNVHEGPAYDLHDLSERVNFYLDVMVDVGTVRADTMVDVCTGRVGLSALETFLTIQQERKSEIDLRVAAYSPLGNPKAQPDSWHLLEKGAESADFIGLLPEADDVQDYPDHIGFEDHCQKGLELAQRLGKMVHVHTDQRVLPGEDGTEQLVRYVRKYGAPVFESGEPAVWAVHAISPTTYEEGRFQDLIAEMAELNIGMICCPSAALGMRQIRQVNTPSYNSIPRVLDMLVGGVKVRLASDNIADICSPSTSADLVDEVLILSAAIRYYQPIILGKLAAGADLNSHELADLKEHLEKNKIEAEKFKRFF